MVITTTAMIVQDFSRVQKIILLKNGTFDFDFDTQLSNLCCCQHSMADHLDKTDCCLFAEDEELCLCTKFLDEGFRVSDTFLTRRGTVRKERKTRAQVIEPEVRDTQLDSYIESLAQM
jgi:hypothetical protein